MFKSIMFCLHAESEETDTPYLAWVGVGGGGWVWDVKQHLFSVFKSIQTFFFNLFVLIFTLDKLIDHPDDLC